MAESAAESAMAESGGSGERRGAQFTTDGDFRGLPCGDRRGSASRRAAGYPAVCDRARQRFPSSAEPDGHDPNDTESNGSEPGEFH